MTSENKVKILSRIVTIINTIELILCAVIIALGNAVSGYSEKMMNGGSDMLSKGARHDAVGGIEVLGGIFTTFGGIATALIGLAMFFFGIMGVLYFLIPVINGIILWVKNNKKLEEGYDIYFKAYKKDGILKTCFNIFPAVMLAYATVSDFSVGAFLVSLLLIMIVAASVYQVRLSSE